MSIIPGSQLAPTLEGGGRRVLLINPPAHDLRLDWARWQQPCGLLQLGALLKKRGADVRLLDFLAEGGAAASHMTRRQVAVMPIENEELAWWSYGLPWPEAARRIRSWQREGWQPTEVWVTTLTSFWWRGAQEVIRRVRYDWWPQARIMLGGVYPTLYPEHAAANCDADVIVTGAVPEAAPLAGDLSLYPPELRSSAGVHIHRPAPVEEIVADMADKAGQGIREFAFFDEEIPGPDEDRFDSVLQMLAERQLKVRLLALGNLPAQAVTWRRVTLMQAAGFSEVYLRWQPGLDGNMEPYQDAADLLHAFGGFKPRAGALSAIVMAGWPGENLEESAAHLLQVAHAVGSVTVFPYQPTRAEADGLRLTPDMANGKLFPFAQANAARFADYADLLRLAAMINSKYRDVTFDFLGGDMVARMVRHSLRNGAWQTAKPAVDIDVKLSSV